MFLIVQKKLKRELLRHIQWRDAIYANSRCRKTGYFTFQSHQI